MPRLSGKVIVICMFTLGILFASGMVFYWDLHTRPFRGLQLALKQEYPGHQISISGGKALKSPGKPDKLRVVFHDVKSSKEELDLSSIAENILRMLPTHLPIAQYDVLEIHQIRSGSATEGNHRSFIKLLKPVR